MSQVTHFLTGWVFANCARLDRRDRALVTLACVASDVDGLGIVLQLLTRNSLHPLLWFFYHHSLHSLVFALVIAGVSVMLAHQRWKTGLLAFVSFHLHLVEALAGPTDTSGRFLI
jgi:inner membrane protein